MDVCQTKKGRSRSTAVDVCQTKKGRSRSTAVDVCQTKKGRNKSTAGAGAKAEHRPQQDTAGAFTPTHPRHAHAFTAAARPFGIKLRTPQNTPGHPQLQQEPSL